MDYWVTLPAPHPSGVAAATLALHLTAGLVAGLLVGLCSLCLSGAALDGLPGLWRWLFAPLRAHRPRRAAQLLVGPLVLGGLACALFVVNLRFFAFNNPALAALVLACVDIVLVGLALGAFASMTQRVTPLAERAGQRWPNLGDRPAVWLMPALGLLCGALVGVGMARSTALAENWEALDLAPYFGLLTLAALTAVFEVATRKGRPKVILGAAVATLLVGALSWKVALGPEAMDGEDNEVLARDSWTTRLYLTLAQRATDGDRDGFSDRFGHGDCNDADAEAFPGSTEGDDCLPDVPLMDEAELLAKMRGPVVAALEPAAPLEPGVTPPTPAVTPPAPAELPVSPSPEPPPELGPDPATEPQIRKPVLKRPYNVLFITMDTVRADHMGYMGYARETTTHLDRLAARSFVFNRAYAPSNMTPASIPAILSGRYVSELYRDDRHFIRFDERNIFLSEMLQGAGYETRGVLTHWYFEPKKRGGLDQGFDKWTVVGTKWGKAMEDASTSQLVSDEGIAQLDQLAKGEKPWFLWLHYLDPHKWYVFHPGFDKRWGRTSKDRYDHEIAFTDHHVGRVLDALKKSDAHERTVVVVTSDHGEAFGEHKTSFHGFSLYEDQLWVPLLVHVPGLEPRHFDKRVGLIDIAPTVLDLAGVRTRERLQGSSLLPDMMGTPLPQRLIYAERPRGPHSAGMRMLIDADLKLVWRASGNRFEMYDLATDPQELTNLIKSHPEEAQRMQSQLASLLKLALDQKGKVTKTR